MNFAFKTPIRGILAAPSSVGKSFFLRKLLLNDDFCFDKPFDKIIWVSGVEVTNLSSYFDDLKTKFGKENFKHYTKLPEDEIENGQLFKNAKNGCLVIGK